MAPTTPPRMDFRTAVFTACALATCACGSLAVFGALIPGRAREYVAVLTSVACYASMIAFAYRIAYTMKTRAPRDVATMKTMMVEITQTNGFQMIVYCAIGVLGMKRRRGANAPALAPLILLSFYQLAATAHKFLERDGRGYWSKLGFSRVFATAQANMELALAMCATMEISLLTPMLLDLLSKEHRSVSRVLAYVQFLRTRYHCQDNTIYRIKFTAHNTAYYHREVWSTMDEKLFQKLPAAARRRLQFIATWFTTPR